MTISQIQHTYLFRFKYLTNKAKIVLSKLALEKFEDFFEFFVVKRKTVCFSKIQNCGYSVEQELNEFIAGMIALSKDLAKGEKECFQNLFTEKQELFFKSELHKISVRAINVLFSFGVDDLASFYKVIIQNDKLSDLSEVRNCGIKSISEIKKLKEVIISSQFLNDHSEIIPLGDEPEPEKVNFNGRIELFFDQKFDQLKTRTKNILTTTGIDSIERFADFFSNGNHSSILNSRNCGDKTRQEIEHFRKIILDAINKNSNSLKVFNFFKDLEIYFFEGNVLRETELQLFKNYYGFIRTDKNESLDEIASAFGLTNERVRQISIRLLDKIKDIAVKVFKKNPDYENKYFYYDYFTMTLEFANRINIEENTSFSPALITYVLANIRSTNYDFICTNDKANSYSGIFVKHDFPLNLKGIVEFINRCLGIRRERNLEFQMADIFNDFKKQAGDCDIMTFVETCKFVESCVTEKKDNIEVGSHRIVFKRNTKVLKYEYLVDILNEHKIPMHYSVIYSECLKRNIDIASAFNVHSTMQHYPEVFGLKGPGIYGLIEWGGYFGTIGDVTEKILTERNRPISRKELVDILSRELYISQDSINTVLFNYGPENRFLKMKNDTVGLRKWEK